MGKNFYKVRIGIKSKGKGKSGGARITNLIFNAIQIDKVQRLYLAMIYDKSERETITEKELIQILNDILLVEQ